MSRGKGRNRSQSRNRGRTRERTRDRTKDRTKSRTRDRKGSRGRRKTTLIINCYQNTSLRGKVIINTYRISHSLKWERWKGRKSGSQFSTV